MTTSLSWVELFGQLEPVLELGSEHIEDNKQKVINLLKQYESKPVDYKKFCFFEKDSYSKNLIKSFGKSCNVIIMCWGLGQSSTIHGHEGSKCFVKVLEGELLEQRFPHPNLGSDKSTLVRDEKLLLENNVCYIDDSIGVHKVTNNSSSQVAVTLHIYVPAYTRCRIYDPSMKSGESVEVCFNSFFGIHSSNYNKARIT